MKINDLVDQVYYINLDDRVDRYDQFWKLNDRLLDKDRTERISAYDAKNKTSNTDYINLIRARSAHLISYTFPFVKALEAGHDEIIIFEDDAEPFFKEVSELEIFISEANQNNYDILFFGGTAQSKLNKETNNLYRVLNNVFTTHAIAFNNKDGFFSKMAEMHKPFDDIFSAFASSGAASDLILSTMTLDHKGYICSKLLYGQFESHSDIDGQAASYNSDMLNRFSKFCE
jgi:hypothetical protein